MATDRPMAEVGEALLRDLVARWPTPVVFIEVDEAGEVILVGSNALYARRFGRTPAEIAGLRARDLAPPAIADAWSRALAELGDAPGVVEIPQPPGLVAPYEYAVVPLTPGPTGRRRFGVVLTDTAQRSAAEQALRASERRLADAQRFGQVGDFELDPRTGQGTWSPEMYRLHGLPVAERPPSVDEWLEQVHPDDRADVARQLQRAQATTAPVHHVFRVVAPGGEVRRIAASVQVERDADGQAARVRGVSRDFTELAGALELARRHAAELELLFNLSTDGVFFAALDAPLAWDDAVDKDARLEWVLDHLRLRTVNASYAAQLGTTIEALGQPTLRQFVPDLDLYRATFRALYDDGRLRLPILPIDRPDGTTILVETEMVCLRDAQGRITGHFGIQRDVTERVRAAEALAQSQERVRVAERMATIGTLAAGIGHEVNNPLTFVLSNLGIVARGLGQLATAHPTARGPIDELTALIDEARDGAERIRATVRDLRALTRSERPSTAPIDPIAAIERALRLAGHELRHRAAIVRDLAPVPPVAIDEGHLVQVVVNLLINAAQALPDGQADRHVIHVVTRAAEGAVVIEVRDTGAGMAPETARRAFDPFFTTKEIGVGTGLGLSISRSLLEQAGGTIVLDSAPGLGTTARVTLRAASRDAAPPAEAASPAGPTPAPAAPRLRILVIDDEPAIPKLLVRALGHDHEVVGETDPMRALDRLRVDRRFDRLVVDLMMPTLSGMDLYAALGEIDAGLQARVIFLTGGAFTDRARAFLSSVPNPRLDKPFDLAALEALLVAPVAAFTAP